MILIDSFNKSRPRLFVKMLKTSENLISHLLDGELQTPEIEEYAEKVSHLTETLPENEEQKATRVKMQRAAVMLRKKREKLH